MECIKRLIIINKEKSVSNHSVEIKMKFIYNNNDDSITRFLN